MSTVVCAVITSNLKLAECPGNVLIKQRESKLNKDSVVNISQLITIVKSILNYLVGALSQKVMNQVNLGLKLILNLDEPF